MQYNESNSHKTEMHAEGTRPAPPQPEPIQPPPPKPLPADPGPPANPQPDIVPGPKHPTDQRNS